MAYALLIYFTPYQHDDIRFTTWYANCNGGSTDFSLSAWMRYISELWQTENGRLSNFLFPLFGIFMPKWLTAITLGTMVSGCIIMIVNVANKMLTLKTVVMTTAATMFLLPWRDAMFVVDVCINYVPTSLCYLVLMSAVFRDYRPRFPLTAIALAFICGWIHEGFSVATLIGFTILPLYRRFINVRFAAIYVALAAGTACCMLSPGTLWRISVQQASIPASQQLAAWGIKGILVFMTLVLFGALAATRRYGAAIREYVSKPPTIFCLTAALTGCIIALAARNGHRPFWYPNLLVIVVWCGLISHDKARHAHLYTLTAFALAAWLAFVVTMQANQYLNYRRITERMMQTAFAPVYDDPTSSIPLLGWGYVGNDLWRDENHLNYLKEKYRLVSPPLVLPTAMKDADWAHPRYLDADSAIVNVGGQLFVRKDALVLYDDIYRAYLRFCRYSTGNAQIISNTLLVPYNINGRIDHFWMKPLKRINVADVRKIEIIQ